MKRDDMVTGILLIAIGLLFLASNLDNYPGLNFGRMWPIILVVVGVPKLFATDPDDRWCGVTLVLVAGIFLAHNYRVMRIHDSWPLFIVLAGLSVMFGSRSRKVEGKKS